MTSSCSGNCKGSILLKNILHDTAPSTDKQQQVGFTGDFHGYRGRFCDTNVATGHEIKRNTKQRY